MVEITALNVAQKLRMVKAMLETKLLPCPFCGGKAVKIVYWDEEEQNEKAWEHGAIQDEEHFLCVRCYDCDIQFFGGVPISGYELIEAWNRRTDTKDEAWECQGNIGG